MTTSQTSSATIYEFPVGGRAGRLKGFRKWDKASQPSAPAPVIMPESGWYHDVAVQEDVPQKN
ncbi:DUF2735 domain-containing protein [Tianweitania sp. BSSL-BM11]|uniref:DUF2735 domain-containing protein n=1 Tax=Tianweitania aestuarii TaxID=2814886 RepID=A0ABS5RTS6_9HYPH|nr:DUF2735 domain-containing protein [Tianweitania aestuarii]MBS9720379.1 DUF2735 domain-containing protein [Tianweitania aestuarii]